MKRAGLTTILLLISVANFAAPDVQVSRLKWDDFRGEVYSTGDLYLSGQPLTGQAMQQIADSDIDLIINLRTPEEMADRKATPIAEAAIAAEKGIRYLQLPSGGDKYPFSSSTVDRLAEILAEEPGRVLLHCNSGRRATHLWVAYLIDHKGLAPDEAIELGRQANFGATPLEQYLKNGLRYSR